MFLFKHLDEDASNGEGPGVGYGEPTFIESAKSVFSSHLGHRWPLKLLILLAIVFWPVLAYWESIRLDPSLFVTEWLKLSVEGIVIFLILDIIRHRSLSVSARQSAHRLLFMTYVV